MHTERKERKVAVLDIKEIFDRIPKEVDNLSYNEAM